MKYPLGWKVEDEMLVKVFEFKNFIEAVEFVNNIAKVAERMNHHPDIEIFSYKKVKIKLKTHNANAVTEKDIDLAEKIDCLNLKEK